MVNPAVWFIYFYNLFTVKIHLRKQRRTFTVLQGMKIFIDFRITYNSDAALSAFTGDFWHDLIVFQPHHHFVLLQGENAISQKPAKNLQVCKCKKTGIKWFDQKKLDKLLAVQQADRLITLHQHGFNTYHIAQKKNEDKILSQSVQWMVPATTPAGKELTGVAITLIRPACAGIITSLSWAEAESIKTQYSGGRDFFLFTGNISDEHQLLELLKAFSLFKKWQQSNMQLVIAGYTTAWTEVLEEKLLTYKYKADIILVKNAGTAEMARLMAACYAVVYPVASDAFPMALLAALQSKKAIITTDNDVNRQIVTAAEWVDKNNTAEGFAKAMILLYKDEKQQQLLVQQNSEQALQCNRLHMLEAAWKCIEQ